MRLIVISLVAMALFGCTSAIPLRNPATGQTAECGPFLFGPFWIRPVEAENRCLDDYHRQGFERQP